MGIYTRMNWKGETAAIRWLDCWIALRNEGVLRHAWAEGVCRLFGLAPVFSRGQNDMREQDLTYAVIRDKAWRPWMVAPFKVLHCTNTGHSQGDDIH